MFVRKKTNCSGTISVVHDGQQKLDFDDHKGKEVEETERFLSNIDNVLKNPNRFLC